MTDMVKMILSGAGGAFLGYGAAQLIISGVLAGSSRPFAEAAVAIGLALLIIRGWAH